MNSTNRKLRLQPALASLTDDEREKIADWLRTQTYAQVQARVAKTRDDGGFGLNVSVSVLQRLRDRTATLQQINDQLEDKQNLADLLAAQNGEKVEWAKGTYELVQRAAFKIALLPDQTPARLSSLLRLADHPRQVANDEHKKQVAERNTAVREGQLTLSREKHDLRRTSIPPSNSDLNTKSPKPVEQRDELGPYARNLDDIRERARKAFGITPEESARRAELRRTWKPPELTEPQPIIVENETIPLQQVAENSPLLKLNENGGTSSQSPTSNPSPQPAAEVGPLSPTLGPTLDRDLNHRKTSTGTGSLNLIDLLRELAPKSSAVNGGTPSGDTISGGTSSTSLISKPPATINVPNPAPADAIPQPILPELAPSLSAPILAPLL